MDRYLTIGASVMLLLLVGIGWLGFAETGCWSIAGKTSQSYAFCGASGAIAGLLISAMTAFVVWRWLWTKND